MGHLRFYKTFHMGLCDKSRKFLLFDTLFCFGVVKQIINEKPLYVVAMHRSLGFMVLPIPRAFPSQNE